jgi:hypothetical protein
MSTIANTESAGTTHAPVPRSCSPSRSSHKGHSPYTLRWLHHRMLRAAQATTIYEVSDRLHEGRSVHVPCDQIATTISAWLIELGAHSPLVEDLARAIQAGDWPGAYAIGEYLSVDVAIAA